MSRVAKNPVLIPAGVEVKFEIWEGMWHVFHGAAAMGVPESQAALDKIGVFVRKHIWQPWLNP